MTIAILGTGRMAAALGARLTEGGHEVRFLGRDPNKAEQLAERFGDEASAGVIGEPFGGETEVVVIAVRYPAVPEVLSQYEDADLSNMVVVDITNPVNPEYDGLLVGGDTSAGEQIAALVPAPERVVKAFNTTFHTRLAEGQAGGLPLDVFIAGDDPGAKAAVAGLVEDGGMRAVDVGVLYRARALEAIQLLHIMAQNTLDTGFQTQIKFLS